MNKILKRIKLWVWKILNSIFYFLKRQNFLISKCYLEDTKKQTKQESQKHSSDFCKWNLQKKFWDLGLSKFLIFHYLLVQNPANIDNGSRFQKLQVIQKVKRIKILRKKYLKRLTWIKKFINDFMSFKIFSLYIYIMSKNQKQLKI